MAALFAVTTGCGGGGAGEITVFAAASLTEPFQAVAAAYEADHPGVTVTLVLAGSQRLAAQIIDGAPADVFASANERQMAAVVGAAMTASIPETFASNSLAIAIEPGNPKRITSLSDLARPGIVVVLAAPGVPVGDYAAAALAAAGVTVHAASEELDVKSVVSKVALGEADAGIVYATDIQASGGAVEGVTLSPAADQHARYLVAAVAGAPNPGGAADLIGFLLSEEGMAIMAEYGFGSP